MSWINLPGTLVGDSEEAFQQLWPEDRALRPIVFSTADIHFSHFPVIVYLLPGCRDSTRPKLL